MDRISARPPHNKIHWNISCCDTAKPNSREYAHILFHNNKETNNIIIDVDVWPLILVHIIFKKYKTTMTCSKSDEDLSRVYCNVGEYKRGEISSEVIFIYMQSWFIRMLLLIRSQTNCCYCYSWPVKNRFHVHPHDRN